MPYLFSRSLLPAPCRPTAWASRTRLSRVAAPSHSVKQSLHSIACQSLSFRLGSDKRHWHEAQEFGAGGKPQAWKRHVLACPDIPPAVWLVHRRRHSYESRGLAMQASRYKKAGPTWSWWHASRMFPVFWPCISASPRY